MIGPLVNILVRTSNREKLFNRMLNSIAQQTYPYIRVIVAYDESEYLTYVPDICDVVLVTPDRRKEFFYNGYCNLLKAQVTDGWFFFLDDDDILANRYVISTVVDQLMNQHRSYIVQYLRGSIAKPSWFLSEKNRIMSGRIGLPCIWLHHSYKNLFEIDSENEDGDFRWIKKVTSKLKPKFLQEVVVVCDRRSKGIPEKEMNDYSLIEAFQYEPTVRNFKLKQEANESH